MPRPRSRPAAQAALTRPVRTIRAELIGDYGFWCDMRTNSELRTLDLLSDSKDIEALRLGVAQLVVHHNLVDFEGNPLLLDASSGGLTTEELYAILNAYYTALRKATALPKDDAAS